MLKHITQKYNAKIDSKKRITIRGAEFEFYEVNEFDDGKILLSPKVLVDPDTISENTLQMMDKSIENMDSGLVSNPINLQDYLELIEDD
jgi:hypothetical protein